MGDAGLPLGGVGLRVRDDVCGAGNGFGRRCGGAGLPCQCQSGCRCSECAAKHDYHAAIQQVGAEVDASDGDFGLSAGRGMHVGPEFRMGHDGPDCDDLLQGRVAAEYPVFGDRDDPGDRSDRSADRTGGDLVVHDRCGARRHTTTADVGLPGG